MQKNKRKLLEPATAIETYFDNLLQEDSSVGSRPVALKSNLRVFSDLEAELNSIDQIALQEEQVNPATDGIQHEQMPGHEPELPSYRERIEFPMQCLMFHVGDNQLSIPIVELHSIVPGIENLTRLPHAPEWFIGVIQHRDSSIKVVDTARLLSIKVSQLNNETPHVLVFRDADWGITCDHPGEIIYLHEDDVKWSKARPDGLLLGTIKQSLAVLLDAEKIIKRVSNGERQEYC